jgi:16S rRNA (adenine1518-N6/adenine1519-N6)-dimethyltransferase
MNTLVTPKKKFGQNFLTNIAVKQKVFGSIDTFTDQFPERALLEIGPGQGDLTGHILSLGRKTDILEIDEQALEVVTQQFGENHHATFHLIDALEEVSNPKSTLFSKKTILISNLPFNVGSRILVELGVSFPHMPFLVILQKEVAIKLFPEKSDFTIFGAWIRLWWNVEYIMTISRGSFTPVPNVDCGCVIGKPKENLILKGKPHEKLLDILKKLNSMPNKTVANNLSKHFMTKSEAARFLGKYNLTPTTRLTWENYELILKGVYEWLY